MPVPYFDISGASPMPDPRVVAALAANAVYVAYAQAWQDELEYSVFRAAVGDCAKAALANQRVLANLNTLPVLQFIWKESSFVGDGDLAFIGLGRSAVDGPLTMHGLTLILHADQQRGIGAAIKRVAKIVRAGRAYGLIETRRVREKRLEIAGTAALHALMLRVQMAQALRLSTLRNGRDDGDDTA